MRITPTFSIDESEINERFVRASGPGGQNVNKVETAVQLRFDVHQTKSFSDVVKMRLLRLAGNRATRDGVLVIEAKRFRTQERNRADARARLKALVEQALREPKKRIATKTPPRAKRKRLDDKRRRGELKLGRTKPILDA